MAYCASYIRGDSSSVIRASVFSLPLADTNTDMARLDVTETFYNIKFPGHMHTQDSLNYAADFKFRDTDTVIITYPKSGMDFYASFMFSQILICKVEIESFTLARRNHMDAGNRHTCFG